MRSFKISTIRNETAGSVPTHLYLIILCSSQSDMSIGYQIMINQLNERIIFSQRADISICKLFDPYINQTNKVKAPCNYEQ